MILTFIGMSGVGKTFWAAKLAAQGFTWFHCDALLATKLHSTAGPVGLSLSEIGQWMGLPHQTEFQKREAIYLACETAVMREVIAIAGSDAYCRMNCVIDTGGSAVYADSELFQQLQRFTTVVYLTIPAILHQQMLMTYLANPLPLIWNGLFSQKPGETLEEAFRRCYSQLIRHREQLYESYSNVRLEYNYHRHPALTAESLLRHIQAAADQARGRA